MDHILSGCKVLAKTEYNTKHNKAAAHLHWKICQDYDIETTNKWYEHKPETAGQNTDNITILWDMAVHTDRTITANRPDIIVKELTNFTCKLINMTIPSDRNTALKETEKKSKCKDLELEIQRMWHVKTEVVPVVVGALGTIKKGMIENIKKVSESYCDRNAKDLYAGICTNPKGRRLVCEQKIDLSV